MSCCVPICKSSWRTKDENGKRLSFHEFPCDEEQKAAWLKNISRKDFVPNINSNSSRVCSRHFKASDYLPNIERRQLQKGAVPTVFEDYPSYKVPVERKKRAPIKRKCPEISEAKFKRSRKETIVPEENTAEVNSSLHFSNSEVISNSCDDNTHSDDLIVPNVSSDCIKKEDFDVMKTKLSTLNRKVRNMSKLLSYKNKSISKLQQKVLDLTKKLDYYKKDEYFSSVEGMVVRQGEDKSCIQEDMILSQIKNIHSKSPRWSETVIRECIFLHSVSPKGYRFIRNRKLLQLPSMATLHRYIGPVTGEVGVSDLIKARLKEEAENKKPEEKFTSLVIDEMAIKAQCIYDKKLDSFFGPKTELNNSRVRATPANRLLCFLLSGLSTTFSIPCAYYFTKQLTGQELYELTCIVLKAVEECGFYIVRIVTDNLSTNVSMFKKFAEGELKEHIPHPLDANRKLFFSFDQNHIIKNIRSLFLEKDMHDGDGLISGKYLKRLYTFQSKEIIKPVRNLTIKHVSPSNFEKMNVRRAVKIFSPPVTAALGLLSRQNELFKDAGATIKFLENVYEWFSIHDVCNRTQYIYARNASKMHFFSCNDDRLNWLEDFLGYLETIKVASSSQKPPLKFLSKETYEAIILTTKSTIACIKYLLSNGYHYILTRSFNSDAIESFFSSLRQMCGANDMMDVRATIFALEKILKVGFINASEYSSVGKRQDVIGRKIIKGSKPIAQSNFDLPDAVTTVLQLLHKEPDTPRTSLKTAALAYVAGYIVMLFEENIDCEVCIENIGTVKCSTPLLSLIDHQDRGGLKYPKSGFISILSVIQEFVEQAVKILPFQNVSSNLRRYILPHLFQCPILKCPQENHTKISSEKICDVFLPVLLKNIASNVPVRQAVLNKPLNRKVLKLS